MAESPRINFNQNEATASERVKYAFMVLFSTLLFGAAFIFNTPSEIWHGNIIIITSSANLITDYFKIANVGAALVNASIMAFQGIAILKLNRKQVNGLQIAAVFTLAGFSLFGKNLYNSFPIILGVFIYSRVFRSPFSQYVPVALFGTALGPLVSEVTFDLGLPLYLGIILGVFAGVIAGFVMPPLALHFTSFHKGFSLYNIGFTAGIVGTFFTAIFRSFGVEPSAFYAVAAGHNLPMSIILAAVFLIMLIIGMAFNGWSFRNYNDFMKQSGQGKTDFIKTYGFGLVSINMALLGILTTAYVLVVGGELNGPVIGGILTVVGFGAAGKHIKNVIPILIGVYLVSHFSIHDVSSTAALLAALFGTTLAPVAGHYGIIAGIITGGLHMSLTTNIGNLHAGMNLYNNGFSGGFIAAVVVPIIDAIVRKVSEVKEYKITERTKK